MAYCTMATFSFLKKGEALVRYADDICGTGKEIESSTKASEKHIAISEGK